MMGGGGGGCCTHDGQGTCSPVGMTDDYTADTKAWCDMSKENCEGKCEGKYAGGPGGMQGGMGGMMACMGADLALMESMTLTNAMTVIPKMAGGLAGKCAS